MASVSARRRCPDLVFVKPRFAAYKAVSQQIRAIFAEFTPLVEPLSLDEAYLDVTQNLGGIASATAVAEAIRARILAETELTASAGVSYNKFLAKLASDFRKPNGLYVVTPAQGPGFVEGLAVGKFHGIGPVTAAKMNRLGIVSGLDLRRQSEADLSAHSARRATTTTTSHAPSTTGPSARDRIASPVGRSGRSAKISPAGRFGGGIAAVDPVRLRALRAHRGAGPDGDLKVKFPISAR